jgi:energy-coupling factor transporter ATP-binding protein EcfA2
VAFQLVDGEPEGGPWRAKPLTTVVEALVRLGTDRTKSRQGLVLAVDGRSSSGKTTLAERMHGALPNSTVVHTDDLAWSHSRFGWSDLLIDGVLEPFSCGELVRFRPPSWAEHGRPGSIEVAATCAVLIIEGVGAGRVEAGQLLDSLVWVQADRHEAEQRSLARIGQPGGARTVGNYRDWMAEEEPFLAHQRPWERADLLVAGTPQISFDAADEIVVAPPLA